MKTVSLFFPGVFDDAYVYMGRLLAFTAERTLRVWNLDKLVENIQAKYPASGEIPKWMFCRNDWLALEPFASVLKNPKNLRNVIREFDAFPDHCVVESITCDDEMELQLKSEHLLHVLVYNSRLYLATDNGLFHLDLDFGYDGELDRVRPEKRLDSRCISTSAGYGSVLASCGDDGLFAAADEFGFLEDAEVSREFQQTKERSIRTAWLGNDVVNYRSSADFALFQAKYERAHRASRRGEEERESRVLTGVDGGAIPLDALFNGVKEKYQLSKSDVQYVYNSSGNFFLNTFSGRLFGARIEFQRHPTEIDITLEDDIDEIDTFSQSGPATLKYLKEYTGSGSSVLSASSARPGIVFERDTDVVLWSNNNWHSLASEPALSVRTFIRSKRFQHLVAITLEKGIELTGLFNEEVFATKS